MTILNVRAALQDLAQPFPMRLNLFMLSGFGVRLINENDTFKEVH
jgi:hypothetical protein